ncbi:hypothetical protein FSPOR_6275 [Fusarium sporotrichioides]|uniref:Cytochrome b5 heme-binding domain-containing protein n=1 Tax=Fusarium sporotrichioides TaxID=5514 RepID=A0A395S3B3_FUSSP|nr:hypothetical protein FSPOR_6275 [Fusarium sporotrichioides]
MGYIGISLIVASVVWVIVRPPSWMPEPLQVLLRWRGGGLSAIAAKDKAEAEHDSDPGPSIMVSDHEVEPGPRLRARPADNRTTQDDNQGKTTTTATSASTSLKAAKSDVSSMPPPPLPKVAPPPPTIAEPEEQTTPKAVASNPPSINVPSFSLDNAPIAPSSHPAPRRNPTAPGPAPALGLPTAHQPSMMPPPPPGRLPPPTSTPNPPVGRLPTLSQFPAANSPQRARGPVPNRGPSSSLGGGLAPPPTHSAKPNKPSRKVLLTPGHSPLDWARISGPNADLRGVEPSTPYLRVTPSMLKRMTGRKGKDAWMALNGKVYNVTPYADFHPGGVPELMRGAGRDATKLYGEVHPWVNYETMLSACLVGLLVEESEGTENKMDQMD